MNAETSLSDRLADLETRFDAVSPAQARELQTGGATLIDVRETAEHAQGLPAGAHALSRGLLESGIADIAPSRQADLLLICGSGARSLLACESLRQLGYEQLRSVRGGFRAWTDAGLPWALPESDDPALNARYARQVQLPEIGPEGQRKLARARVLLVGAGGLGSPAALYLAGAGVGTLTLVDADRVDRSNLHRQVLHDDAGLDRPKTDSARDRLAALNPDIHIRTHETRLTRHNIETLFAGQDLIIDGSDNFPTRYLVNDACQKLGLTLISAAVQGFEGQLSVFEPGGPCYRCLFAEPPPPELAPSCAEAGVAGMVPGVMGVLQALEALKLLVGFGEPLRGRLIIFDARRSTFRQLRMKRDPDCAYCDPDEPFPGYVDYDHFCAQAPA
jgi:molybdopterin/thiamine biosynthesis adenylyltransferase/rhodanese-related sulfurtransferase